MKNSSTVARRATDCSHHWVIATPNGAESDGYCKHCGSQKAFPNAIDDRIWTSDGFNLSGTSRRTRIA